MGRHVAYLMTILMVTLALLIGSSRLVRAAQAVLGWNVSTDATVSGYKVYFGTQSGSYQAPIDAGNTTTYTVTGLSETQTYYFAVTAYSSTQESPLSQELSCNFITTAAVSNGQITPAGTTAVVGGGSQTYSIVPNPGYQIGALLIDGQQVSPASSYTFSNVNGSHTIAATFVAAGNIISASSQTGGSIAPSGAVVVAPGANQTFKIVPAANYKISNLLVDGASKRAASSYTFKKVVSAHSIVAKFALVNGILPTSTPHKISATFQGRGAISPSGVVSVASGASQTFNITPGANYEISAVKVDGASKGAVSSFTFSNVASNHKIVAVFRAVPTYTISTSFQGGGSISPSGSVRLSSGASATFAITPCAGYQISGVQVDNRSVGAVSSYSLTNVTQNHNIKVLFAASKCAISASVQGGGTISPPGTSRFGAGTKASYAITPSKGYRLQGIMVDGIELSSGQLDAAVSSARGAGGATYAFSNLDRDHVISAVFVPAGEVVADAGADQDVKSGATVTLDGSNSTAPGGRITSFKWTQISGPAVSMSNPASSSCTFRAQDVTTAEPLAFKLSVTDSDGVSASDYCLVNVSSSGGGPLVTGGRDQTVSAFTNVTLDGSSSSDSYAPVASYRWTQIAGPSVAILNANTPAASFVAPDAGAVGATIVFELSVRDQYGLQARGQWTVSVVGDYEPPVADAGADIGTGPGRVVQLNGTGSQDLAGSSDTYRWTQISGVPVSLSDPTSGSPTFRAPDLTRGQTSELVFMLTVRNSEDRLSSTSRCTVSVGNPQPSGAKPSL